MLSRLTQYALIVVAMIYDSRFGLNTKERPQGNFDSRSFADNPSVSVLYTEGAQRSAQKCDRYTVEELQWRRADEVRPLQVYHGETSTTGDVFARIRQVRDYIKARRQAYRDDVQAYWRDLLARNKLVKVRWRSIKGKRFFNTKYRKVPTGKTREVVVPVRLAGRWVTRFRWRVHYVVRDGRVVGRIKEREPYRRWVVPKVYRVLKLPIYRKFLVRPAGFYTCTLRREKTHINTYNWPLIRASYIVYKGIQHDRLLVDLDGLQAQLQELYQQLAQRMLQPHRLITYTQAGYLPPSWKEYYYQAHMDSGEYDKVYAKSGLAPDLGLTVQVSREGSLTGDYWSSAVACPIIPEGPYRVPLGTDLDVIQRLIVMMGVPGDRSKPFSFEAKGMLHPRTYVDRLISVDRYSDHYGPMQTDLANQLDEQAEAIAVSEVESLRSNGDYVFNLPRSLGELKDSKETFKQARDFLRWFGRGTRTRVTLGSASREAFMLYLRRTGSAVNALIAAWLAWKFAIQPTIQDIETVRTSTVEWLFATRRHLRETIKTIRNESTNIIHIRRKFFGPDSVRRKDLRTVVQVDPSSVGVELTYWNYTVVPRPAAYCEQGGDSQVTVENIEVPGLTLPSVDPHFSVRHNTWSHVTTVSTDKAGTFASVLSTGDKEARVSSQPFLHVSADGYWERTVCDGQDATADSLLQQENWPSAGVNGYVRNQVEGVAFARYQLADLVEFLGSDSYSSELWELYKEIERLQTWSDLWESLYHKTLSGLAPDGSTLLDRLTAPYAWDAVFVAWQLTPLSFVYDWFTTSESIAVRLNNFAVEFVRPAPSPMEGVWVTKRLELLAGRPGLEVLDTKCSEYVSDWWGGCVKTTTYHKGQLGTDYAYWAVPRRIERTCSLLYRSDREVELVRSGLYAVKRGEYVSGGWETFLPKPLVRLNTSKIATLLGMLTSFLTPR